MAQKKEREETELKVLESIPICTLPPTISGPSPQISAVRSSENPDPIFFAACNPRTRSVASPEKSKVAEKRVSLKRPKEVSQCSGLGCRKKIGLMGYRCRCGDMLCSKHRYSDRRDCSYDYKAAGQEAIERENPVVRAAKLLKNYYVMVGLSGRDGAGVL